jgi:hypothetical protein
MVKAILDGRKSQTRRVIKPQPEVDDIGRIWFHNRTRTEGVADTRPGTVSHGLQYCPYGQPGDGLWVRETHALDVPGCEDQGGVSYRADHQDPRGDGPAHPMKWRPSIHMPRWASRTTLEVTDVRVERVMDISEGDAVAEGVEFCSMCSARDMFEGLWDSINAARGFGWDVNPWVWCVTFKVVA